MVFTASSELKLATGVAGMLPAAYSPDLVRKITQDEQKTRRSTQRDHPQFMIVSQARS
jgi:hypothetical protein